VDGADDSQTPVRTADNTISLEGTLAAGKARTLWVLVPPAPPENARLISRNGIAGHAAGDADEMLTGSIFIHTPDSKINNLIRAAQIHCLMAARNEANGERIAPWISSMYYGPLESESNSIIRGMDMLGHEEFARKSLDYFIEKYDPSGMLTTGYTLMGL